MLASPKDNIMDIIHSTARFGEAYALHKHKAIIATAQDAIFLAELFPAMPSSSAFISILGIPEISERTPESTPWDSKEVAGYRNLWLDHPFALAV